MRRNGSLGLGLVGLAAALCAATATLYAISAPTAQASTMQVAILQDQSVLDGSSASIEELRHLGVRLVRVFVRWSDLAPDPLSRHQPSVDLTRPASYSAAGWATLDTIVKTAASYDMSVLMNVTGGAPLWAVGGGAPKAALQNPLYAWNPSSAQFAKFVHAVAVRYSGHYAPCAVCRPLPAARYWEIYNEENFGLDLSPQAVDGSRLLASPVRYRALFGAAWTALMATGHRHDTILLGGLAPGGSRAAAGRRDPLGLPGYFGMTKPLVFLRVLYCLNGRYRPYRGAAARLRGCPATAAASRRFRAQNPGLFELSGIADHPYPFGSDVGLPPDQTRNRDPDFAMFSQLPHLARALDRIFRAYGSRARIPIWSTEYGRITNPPNRSAPYPSPATQAYYLNWAEYLSWRNPRIKSFMQYLLADPNPVDAPEYGGFASGLEFYGGRPKPSYDAWRLPLYLPRTSGRRGGALEVWGCVRPAYYAALDTHQPQRAEIQFRRSGSGSWSTVRTLTFSGPNCYFDVRIAFGASGLVRLSYSYPPADLRLTPTTAVSYVDPIAPAVSRTVSVTVK